MLSVVVWDDWTGNISPWARVQTCVAAGVLYTTGLLPYALNQLEFHVAIWHLFGAMNLHAHFNFHWSCDPVRTFHTPYR